MDVTTTTTTVASRGWHEYGKSVWKTPKKGEFLYAEKESDTRALQIDPYAIAWKRKVQSKIVADTVGHVPQEISRFVFYFLERGGSLSGTVHSERYVASPMPKGGLEIIIDAQFSMVVEKR